ncbi:unnamed protein product, partial [marine sediment metagenome]
IEEKGPVRVILGINRSFNESRIKQKIILYRDLERIDFFTKIDWQEKGSHKEGIPMLRVFFHLNFSSPEERTTQESYLWTSRIIP